MAGNQTKRGDDASVYSAIHWFMLVLEKRAIELYSTNADSYKEINSVLTQAAVSLGKIKNIRGGDDDEPCPDGYVFCDDLQLCCPACFTGSSVADQSSRKAPKK
jgi:hypothetical protein